MVEIVVDGLTDGRPTPPDESAANTYVSTDTNVALDPLATSSG